MLKQVRSPCWTCLCVIVYVANVEFDKLDEGSPEPRASGKRKSESSSSASKSDKKSRTVVPGRSRYPQLDYNFDKVQNTSSESSEDQYQQLSGVLNSICKKEITGLQDHFKKLKSKSDICSSLVGVLNRLPAAVSKEPIEGTFSPEVSRDGQSELQSLVKERDDLHAFLKRLTELDESPELLNSQYDMWSSSDRASKTNSSFNKELGSRTKALENVVVEYRQLLKSLESRCDVIIGGTGELNSQVDAARRAQEEVYEVFNKVSIVGYGQCLWLMIFIVGSFGNIVVFSWYKDTECSYRP